MARNIIIVNATQIVVSESHPEGLFSVMTGFPKVYDSESYNGDVELTMRTAKSAYFDQLSKNYSYANRAMTTVTLETATGRQLLRECVGSIPNQEEEEPVEEPEEEPEA